MLMSACLRRTVAGAPWGAWCHSKVGRLRARPDMVEKVLEQRQEAGFEMYFTLKCIVR